MSHPDDPLKDVPSPCVRVCCLDENDICLGCYRSLKEIIGWSAASDSEKTAALIRCRSRYVERCARIAAHMKRS